MLTSAKPVPEVLSCPTSSSPGDWDRFAQACGASFRCTHRATLVWQLERRLPASLLRMDFLAHAADGPTKVAQCAVGVASGRFAFADSIQVLPSHAHLWPSVMQAVVDRLGPGRYEYGSDWNLEPCRALALETLVGVKIEGVRPVDVMAVDLGSFPTWDAYYRGVSQNARRNVEKARKAHEVMGVDMRQGLGAFLDLVPLEMLRADLFRTKEVPASLVSLVARSGLRLAATSAYSRSLRLADERRTLARALCIDFGSRTYFLEAATAVRDAGEASFLLRHMIEDAWHRSGGKGVFVMGPDDGTLRGQKQWEGLRRSREQWRATPHPTSVVSFTYAR